MPRDITEPASMNGLKAAIYARQSTVQLQESVEHQITRAEKYSEKYGFEIVDVITEKKSGLSRREKFEDMCHRIIQGELDVDCICLWTISRLTRENILDSGPVVSSLVKCVNFIETGKPRLKYWDFDKGKNHDEIDDLTDEIKLANKFSRELSERCLAGKVSRALEMKTPPKKSFGFIIDGEKKNGRYTWWKVKPNKDADIVRDIFKKFSEGLNLSAICNWLNEDGVKTSKSQNWTISSVRNLLRNPAYVGDLELFKSKAGRLYSYSGDEIDYLTSFNRTEGFYEWKTEKNNSIRFKDCPYIKAIVDRDTWNKVQAELDGRKRGEYVPRKHSRKNPFSRIIVCTCGKALTTGSNEKRLKKIDERIKKYYTCCDYYRNYICPVSQSPNSKDYVGFDCPGGRKSVPEREVMAGLKHVISSILTDHECLKTMIDTCVAFYENKAKVTKNTDGIQLHDEIMSLKAQNDKLAKKRLEDSFEKERDLVAEIVKPIDDLMRHNLTAIKRKQAQLDNVSAGVSDFEKLQQELIALRSKTDYTLEDIFPLTGDATYLFGGLASGLSEQTPERNLWLLGRMQYFGEELKYCLALEDEGFPEKKMNEVSGWSEDGDITNRDRVIEIDKFFSKDNVQKMVKAVDVKWNTTGLKGPNQPKFTWSELVYSFNVPSLVGIDALKCTISGATTSCIAGCTTVSSSGC